MDPKVQVIVRKAIETIIAEATTEKQIQRKYQLHKDKIHFIPTRYRVLNGILQALNIKFGNFIEQLIELVVENDTFVEKLPDSGKRIGQKMTPKTDRLIDEYITKRQLPDSPDSCDDQYFELLHRIFETEWTASPFEMQNIRQDVDVLFRAKDGRAIYLEVKYNDDHDTGKFVNINRKFLKTYAGLLNHLEVENLDSFVPFIYYFNPTKRYGSIYVPSSHIYRGRQLFDEFFEMKFDDIDLYLRQIGDDEAILSTFDELYSSVRYNLKVT